MSFNSQAQRGEEVLLIRYGEIGLKGLNQGEFMDALKRHILFALRDISGARISHSSGRFFAENIGDVELALDRLSRIPGIVAVNPALRVESHIDAIAEAATRMAGEAMETTRGLPRPSLTFKVKARRQDKTFPYKSPEIEKVVGARVLEECVSLSVDIHNPDFILNIEVRDSGTYIYWREKRGPGGLPLGASGKGLLLISGGIDSPVAGYMGIKRGVAIDAIHFWSYPVTSERARDKVIDLCRVLQNYNPWLRLYIAHFAAVQTSIIERCPERYRVIAMRRMMMRVASRLAAKAGALAIFTGENLGQVASQTLESLRVIEEAAALPVIRPLVCFDKQETVRIAKEIGTYDLSCLPYEDCCTVFVPRHPVTRPSLQKVLEAERDLPIDNLVEKCVDSIQEVLSPVSTSYLLKDGDGYSRLGTS